MMRSSCISARGVKEKQLNHNNDNHNFWFPILNDIYRLAPPCSIELFPLTQAQNIQTSMPSAVVSVVYTSTDLWLSNCEATRCCPWVFDVGFGVSGRLVYRC